MPSSVICQKRRYLISAYAHPPPPHLESQESDLGPLLLINTFRVFLPSLAFVRGGAVLPSSPPAFRLPLAVRAYDRRTSYLNNYGSYVGGPCPRPFRALHRIPFPPRHISAVNGSIRLYHPLNQSISTILFALFALKLEPPSHRHRTRSWKPTCPPARVGWDVTRWKGGIAGKVHLHGFAERRLPGIGEEVIEIRSATNKHLRVRLPLERFPCCSSGLETTGNRCGLALV